MKQNTILRLSKTRYPCCWVRISNLSSKYISIDEQFCYHRFLQSKSTAKQRMLHTCWERDSKETYVVKFVKRYTHLLLCSFIDARTNVHGGLDVMSIQQLFLPKQSSTSCCMGGDMNQIISLTRLSRPLYTFQTLHVTKLLFCQA